MKKIQLSRMKIITLILVLLLGCGLALMGYLFQQPLITTPSILLAVVWAVIIVIGKPDLNLAFFVLDLVPIGFGVLSQLPFFWMAVLLCLDIAAWNLGEFSFRLIQYENVHNQRKLENKHLKQLGITLGIGLLIAVLTTLINIKIPFLLLMFLVILVVVVIGVGLRILKPEEPEF